MFWQKKKLQVPENNENKEIESIQLWYVSWYSRFTEYSTGTEKCVEAFPSKQEADTFAESLRNAFKLIKHTSGNVVRVWLPKP